MKERNITFDYIKAIAVIMVILHHSIDSFAGSETRIPEILSLMMVFLHTCHVPVFLIVSGYFCHEQPIKLFYVKKLKRVYVPFVVFSLLKLAYSALISAEYSHGGESFGSQIKYSFLIGRQYWFVYTILGCFLLAPLFWTKGTNKNQSAAIALIISYLTICIIWIGKITLPDFFQFDRIVNYLPYFTLGVFFKQYKDNISIVLRKRRTQLSIVSLVIMALFLLIYQYNPKIRIYPIRFWVALSFFYFLHEILRTKKKESIVLNNISRYSLQIMFFDGFYRVILFSLARRFDLMNIGIIFIITVTIILISVITCLVVERLPGFKRLVGL